MKHWDSGAAGISINDFPAVSSFAGDQVILTVSGPDPSAISVGSVLCDPTEPIRVTSRIEARIVIFNIDIPITKGYPVRDLLNLFCIQCCIIDFK